MALPKSVVTPRGLEPMAKVNAADPAIKDWPSPTNADCALIGGIVVMYSYVEFNLRRLCEALDRAGLLPIKFKGKSTKLDIGEVEKAVKRSGMHRLGLLQTPMSRSIGLPKCDRCAT